MSGVTWAECRGQKRNYRFHSWGRRAEPRPRWVVISIVSACHVSCHVSRDGRVTRCTALLIPFIGLYWKCAVRVSGLCSCSLQIFESVFFLFSLFVTSISPRVIVTLTVSHKSQVRGSRYADLNLEAIYKPLNRKTKNTKKYRASLNFSIMYFVQGL